MPEDAPIRDAAQAIEGIVKAVPVYQDVVQPAAQEVGAALKTVAKTIHIVLAPISATVWGYERLQEFLETKVAAKLARSSPAELQMPAPNVIIPALEAVRLAGDDPVLQDMFANLIATSLDPATARTVHPSFVEVLRQLSPDEARICKLFRTKWDYPAIELVAVSPLGDKTYLRNLSRLPTMAKCAAPEMGPEYVENLRRLGLVDLWRRELVERTAEYEELEKNEQVAVFVSVIEKTEGTGEVKFRRMSIDLTVFGQFFCRACVFQPDEIPDFPVRPSLVI